MAGLFETFLQGVGVNGQQLAELYQSAQKHLAPCTVPHCGRRSPGVICTMCSGHTCLQHFVLLPQIPKLHLKDAHRDEKMPVKFACLECVVTHYEDSKEAAATASRKHKRRHS